MTLGFYILGIKLNIQTYPTHGHVDETLKKEWGSKIVQLFKYIESTNHTFIVKLLFRLSYVCCYSKVGMSGGLETISGQAYGAKQYMKVGTQTYTAIFSLTILVIPLSIIWINMGKLLIILGQDPLVAHEAGKFMTYLVPTLFAYAVFQPLVRYFQSQSLVVPMFLSSCATLCLHIPLCWALVYKSGLQNLGGAIAMGLSNWLNAIFLALYMKFSSSCAPTRSPLSIEIFDGIGQFFRFAIPSAAMIWWVLI